MAMANIDEYHIQIFINKSKIKNQLNSAKEKLVEIANSVEKSGGSANDLRIVALRLGQKSFNVEKGLEDALMEVGHKIIDRVADRYISYQALAGFNSNASIELESALRNKQNNISVQMDANNICLGIMNRDYLTERSLLSSGVPLYELENQKAGLLAKGFITEFSGATEEVIQEDQELIVESIIKKVEELSKENG